MLTPSDGLLLEIGHLAKYDAFSVYRDQNMDLEIWFKIHTNYCNFETAEATFKNRMAHPPPPPPLSLPNFSHASPYSSHFLDDPPPPPQKNLTLPQDFTFLYSLLFPYFMLLCSL